MRLLILLIALAIVGVLTVRQLTGTQTTTEAAATAGVPEVPTEAQQLQNFQDEMNQFVKESAERQHDELNEQLMK